MASKPLEPGYLLNQRYLIIEALGQGGMGTVYKAEHVRLNAIVAVKEIRGQNGDEAQNRVELDRCEHEARFLVRLNHPHLPKVTDAFIDRDSFYLVMDFIEGVTLETCLISTGGRPLDVAQVVEWGLQIADVLAYLHSQDPPIIFRDLKPSNVMVQPDHNIRLIDFGIARRFQPGAVKDTALLGSVGYSPPEQFGKRQTDQRSDVYAFAATLHHLLTGRDPATQPFKFPPARAFNPAVPEGLSHLLEMCLAFDPEDRPDSINVVAVQLLAVREELVMLRARAAAQHAGVAMDAPLSPQAAGAAPLTAEKLAELEKRRAAEREINGGAAGSRPAVYTHSGAARRNPALMLAVLLTVLILGGAAVALVARRPRGSASADRPVVAPPLVVQNTNNGAGDTTSADGQGTSPPAASGTPGQPSLVPAAPGPDTAAPLPAQSAITLQTWIQPISGDLLPIFLTGAIKGRGNQQMQLVLYFFDAADRQIFASDTSNPAYVTTDKHLCAYKTLNVNADDFTVQDTLNVPVKELLNTSQPAPLRYQAMLIQNGQVLLETKREILPASAYGGATSAPTGDSGGVSGSPSSTSGRVIHEGFRGGN